MIVKELNFNKPTMKFYINLTLIALFFFVGLSDVLAQYPAVTHQKKIPLASRGFVSVATTQSFSCGDGFIIIYDGGKKTCLNRDSLAMDGLLLPDCGGEGFVYVTNSLGAYECVSLDSLEGKDDLGNHTADRSLEMRGNDINGGGSLRYYDKTIAPSVSDISPNGIISVADPLTNYSLQGDALINGTGESGQQISLVCGNVNGCIVTMDNGTGNMKIGSSVNNSILELKDKESAFLNEKLSVWSVRKSAQDIAPIPQNVSENTIAFGGLDSLDSDSLLNFNPTLKTLNNGSMQLFRGLGIFSSVRENDDRFVGANGFKGSIISSRYFIEDNDPTSDYRSEVATGITDSDNFAKTITLAAYGEVNVGASRRGRLGIEFTTDFTTNDARIYRPFFIGCNDKDYISSFEIVRNFRRGNDLDNTMFPVAEFQLKTLNGVEQGNVKFNDYTGSKFVDNSAHRIYTQDIEGNFRVTDFDIAVDIAISKRLFATNAAAAAVHSVGQFYYNTTDEKLTRVQ